ncbi:MAG: hypothetical protein AAGK14_04955 [Verrucomicrobiota bacterium]
MKPSVYKKLAPPTIRRLVDEGTLKFVEQQGSPDLRETWCLFSSPVFMLRIIDLGSIVMCQIKSPAEEDWHYLGYLLQFLRKPVPDLDPESSARALQTLLPEITSLMADSARRAKFARFESDLMDQIDRSHED